MQYLGTIDKAKDIINKDFVEKLLGDYQPLINESSKLPYSLISGVPTSLPASDVYPWAKASTKPSYSYSEITGAISTTELQNYLTQNSYLNVTSGDNRYLKLSGGTITNTLQIGSNDNTSFLGLRIVRSGFALMFNPASNNAYIGFGAFTNGTYSNKYMLLFGEMGLKYSEDGQTTFKDILHSGNYSNYALPLSGGRMDSTSYIRWNDGHEGNDFSDWNSVAEETGLKIISSTSSTSNAPYAYSTALHVKGRYGFQLASIGGGNSKFYIRNIRDISDWCQLIHSGNINSFAWTSSNDGADSGLDADLLDGKHADAFALSNTNINLDSFVNQIGYGFKSQGWYDSGAAMMFGANSSYYMLLQGASNGSKIYLRANYMLNGSYVGWKDIAFTDSNVASATQVMINYSYNQNIDYPLVFTTRDNIGTSKNGGMYIDFYGRPTYNPYSNTLSVGNILAMGGITMYSDQRKKTILNHVELSLKDIADAPLIEHYYNSDEKKTTHVGSIAQYWANMNDWFCKLDSEGYYTMEIQNAALASAISVARELDRYETKTDKEIKKLKKRICELEEEVELLKAS